MPNRLILLLAFLTMTTATLAAAPGGRVTLTDTKFRGEFRVIPEVVIDYPRSYSSILQAREGFDEDVARLFKFSSGSRQNFPALHSCNKPGTVVQVNRKECLAYVSDGLSWTYGSMTRSEAKRVLSTDLLYLVVWRGPHSKGYIEEIVDNRDVRYVFLDGSRDAPIREDGIRALRSARRLAGLGLSGRGLSDPGAIDAISDVLKKNRKTLRYLCLNGLSPELLPALLELDKLETLEITFEMTATWTEEQGELWKKFLAKQTNLEHAYLNLKGKGTDSWLTPLKAATDLKTLHVSANITGEAFQTLNIPGLEELLLFGKPRFSNVAVKDISGVQNFPNLKRLSLHEFSGDLDVIKQLKDLEVLLLSNCAGSDDNLVQSLNSRKLRALKISRPDCLSEDGLKAIGELDKLEYLNLADQRMTDDLFIYFSDELPDLEWLYANSKGTPTDRAIEPWLEHRNLRKMSVNRRSLSKRRWNDIYQHMARNARKWREKHDIEYRGGVVTSTRR